MQLEKPVQRAIEELRKLPGVGPKKAQQFVFHLLSLPKTDARRLGTALLNVVDETTRCARCHSFATGTLGLCAICADTARDQATICVVEKPQDIPLIENTKQFQGTYHVLGGALSALMGRGPDQLRVSELEQRITDENTSELIVAIGTNRDGENTADYLARLFIPRGVKVTRLASGLPTGGDLEYVDSVTMSRAVRYRYPI